MNATTVVDNQTDNTKYQNKADLHLEDIEKSVLIEAGNSVETLDINVATVFLDELYSSDDDSNKSEDDEEDSESIRDSEDIVNIKNTSSFSRNESNSFDELEIQNITQEIALCEEKIQTKEIPKEVSNESSEDDDIFERIILRRNKISLPIVDSDQSNDEVDLTEENGKDLNKDENDKSHPIESETEDEKLQHQRTSSVHRKENAIKYSKNPTVQSDESTLASSSKHWIPTSNEGGKYYEKENCCPFCLSTAWRLDRHLLSHHKDKDEVKAIMFLKPGSTERRSKFAELTRKGNEIFNKSKVLNPTGKIIPVRRPMNKKGNYKNNDKKTVNSDSLINKKKSEYSEIVKTIALINNDSESNATNMNTQEVTDNTLSSSKSSIILTEANEGTSDNVTKSNLRIICNICRGYFSKSNLRAHMRVAHGQQNQMLMRDILAMSRKEMYVNQLATERMKTEILPHLKDDLIGQVARRDKIITLYGNKFAERHDISDQAALVRGHLRLLAKMLIAVNEIDNSIVELETIFRGKHWPLFLNAIKKVCEYDEKTKTLGIPYNGETIGMLIRRIIEILDAEYTKEEENINSKDKNNKAKYLKGFKKLFENDYNVYIASKATKTRKIAARNSANEILPNSKDIQTFQKYLTLKREVSIKSLEIEKFSLTHYINIMETTMLLMQIFNRRRAGETDRVHLSDFNSARKTREDDEQFQKLNVQAKKQARKYLRMDCQGKKADGLGSFYISSDEVKILNLIIDNRKNAKISSKNPFLFALPNQGKISKHLSAYRSMCRLTKECNDNYKKIKTHKEIRGTKLRKLAATALSTKKTSKEDLENITRHFGHTEKTHKNFYRKKIDATDVCVTKVLEDLLNVTANTSTQGDSSMDNSRSMSDQSPEKQINISTVSSCEDPSTSRYGESEESVVFSQSDGAKKLLNAPKNKRNLDASSEDSSLESDNGQHNKKKLNITFQKKRKRVAFLSSAESSSSGEEEKDSPLKISKQKLNKLIKRPSNKKRWSSEEKKAFDKGFKDALKENRYPTATEIRRTVEKYPALKNRSEKVIRARFSNLRK